MVGYCDKTLTVTLLPFPDSVKISEFYCIPYPYCLISYRDSTEGSPSCDDLPPYPQDPTAMELDGDSLVDLCK